MAESILGTLYLLILWLAIRPFWAVMRSQWRYKGGRFQFSTLDFLAAVFGLTPTAWLAAASANHSRPDEQFFWGTMTFLFWFVSQCAGIVIVVATNDAPTRSGRCHGNSAMCVFGGALAGLLMPLVAPFLALFHLQETMKEKPKLRKKQRRLA